MATYDSAVATLRDSLKTLSDLNYQLNMMNEALDTDQNAALPAAHAATTITGNGQPETAVMARIGMDKGRIGVLNGQITTAIAKVKTDISAVTAALP